MPRKYTPEERIDAFWVKVDKSGGDDACWIWTASNDRHGYGQVRWDGTMNRAHRVAFLLANDDPGELCVLHRCDNPLCVNPRHLWLGTKAENNRDRVAKGRQARGERMGSCKLSDKQVTEIRSRYAAGGLFQQTLADEYGVHQSQISRIVRKELRTKGEMRP